MTEEIMEELAETEEAVAETSEEIVEIAEEAEESAEVSEEETAEEDEEEDDFVPVSNPLAYRLSGYVLMLIAFAFEVAVFCVLTGAIHYRALNRFSPMAQAVTVGLVGFIFAIFGVKNWLLAERSKPTHTRTGFGEWFLDNFGILALSFIFIPFTFKVVTTQGAAKRTRNGSIVACVLAITICVMASIGGRSITDAQKQAALSQFTEEICWPKFGNRYHISPDCAEIRKIEDCERGTMEEALKAGHVRLCLTCAEREGISDDILKEE